MLSLQLTPMDILLNAKDEILNTLSHRSLKGKESCNKYPGWSSIGETFLSPSPPLSFFLSTRREEKGFIQMTPSPESSPQSCSHAGGMYDSEPQACCLSGNRPGGPCPQLTVSAMESALLQMGLRSRLRGLCLQRFRVGVVGFTE